MSTPSIPNLLSLRGARGGGRGRGRSRGGPGSSASSQSHDAIIQGTDTDASVSRLSAVDLGYLQDPFAAYFVQNPMGPPTRRLPIINRGTYTRTMALDRLIDAFVFDGSGARKQIVSLGAGTDTRGLRLFSRPDLPVLVYHEVDFPAVAARKVQTVQAHAALRAVLGVPQPQPREDGAAASWRSADPPRGGGEYWCHGRDLRDLARPDTAPLAGLRADVPTLLVSECCLCYLETAAARAVVGHFAARLPHLSLVVYEPVRPDDPFGRQMVANLAARRIRMPSLEVYKEPADQDARLRDAGFENVRKMTVEDIWKTWVSAEERERVDHLEGLDEVEEWDLLASHYIVAWGWRGAGFDSWAAI